MESFENLKRRRGALKAIVGAGSVYAIARVLPGTWTKPVIDTALLPAHAQSRAAIQSLSLAPNSSGNWYVTSPALVLSDFSNVNLFVELSNGEADDFAFTSSPRFPLRTEPGVINPPFVINSEPTGNVPPGVSFSYDLTIDVSGLPATEGRLALRHAEPGASAARVGVN